MAISGMWILGRSSRVELIRLGSGQCSEVFGGGGSGEDMGKLIDLRQARLNMGTVPKENRRLSGSKSELITFVREHGFAFCRLRLGQKDLP